MNQVPDKFLDKKKYLEAKKIITERIPKHSIYRSMAIIKYYKDVLDGRIDEKKEKKSGINRWLDEEWIVVDPYIRENKKIKCGTSGYETRSACRPSKSISNETPITISQVIKKHGMENVIKAVDKKNKDPQNLILDWENLIVKKKNKK